MSIERVVISGGGTGGHVFPAIAIADAIKAKYPDCDILFVGANGKMEMEKVPEAGYKIKGLNIAGLQRSLSLKNLSFPFKLLGSLIKAKKIVKEFKPQFAVGVGGYASGPTLMACSRMGIPTFLQEQNSFPGITNKLLAKKAKRIFVAYKGMERFFAQEKVVLSGNPIRGQIENMKVDLEKAYEYFELDPNKKTILVIGGSLGARTINESVSAAHKAWLNEGYQLIWQTGKSYVESISEELKNTKGLCVKPFIKRMDFAYSLANVVISRAGAISVSELCVVGKPTIFVPSPNVSEDHQTKNAMALVKEDASICVKDSEARESLESVLLDLMSDESKQKKLEVNIKNLAKFKAAEFIVNQIESVI
ncbi:MAG: undecaprenyldiphospho-muramoylpentapeptide beta-N-acetylglucosaminyltransferase [Flavobacteriales bacterium]|nr:undecaprenyldiphospho-muramoylpentapeptide beta-N-acetylglucosaminyltransferase [Flavobacteriales bacterium]